MAVQMVKFLCGEGTVDLRIPESVRVLEMRPAKPLSDPDGAVRQVRTDRFSPIEKKIPALIKSPLIKFQTGFYGVRSCSRDPAKCGISSLDLIR